MATSVNPFQPAQTGQPRRQTGEGLMRLNSLYCGAALAALLSTPALAQTPPRSAGDQASTVEDVIVTSRRREEQIQEVPASVSALSGRQLEELNISTQGGLSYILPGVAYVDTGNINAESNIRGAGSGTSRTAGVDAPIAYLKDGASITGGNIGGRGYVRSDLFDLERLEVTRGPQGSLYGVNAVGGVLQAISKRPEAEFGFSGRIGYTFETERNDFEAIVNLPLSETLAFRLGGQFAEKHDGFFRNAFDGSFGDVEEYQGGRASLLWTPTPDVTVFSALDLSDETSASNGVRNLNIRNDPLATALPADTDGPFVYASNFNTPVERSVINFVTVIDYDSDLGRFTSTSLYRERDAVFPQDADGTAPGYYLTPTPAATCATRSCTNVNADLTELISQELRLDGELRPGLDFLIGGNIARRETEFTIVQDGRVISATNSAPSPTANISQASREEETQTGLFASLTWAATDRLSLDFAARYNYSDKTLDAYQVPRVSGTTLCAYTDPLSVDPLVTPQCVRQRAVLQESFSNAAPTFSARYDLTPDWRVFASYALGYRAGGFNSNTVLDPAIPAAFEPEQTKAFEAGTKFETLGALFSLTGFFNEFDDLLVTVDSLGPDNVTRNYRFNAGAAESYGVDFEVNGRVDVNGNGGSLGYTAAVNYLKGEITGGRFDGARIEGSPEWTYTFTGIYSQDLVDDWRFGANASYRAQRGGFTGTVGLTNRVELADLDLVGASLWLSRGPVRLELVASNLLDETYESIRNPTTSTYGDPRTVRLGLVYRFGSEAR
ncbi:TonB-dependent receptor [Brevundimonas aurifodinae]|uniref:TonB-dependent receptor n=1 Tax=Brevundimonas aurifodinae TaxID=1508312 RepID=A0ABV1NL46_9CAUL